MKITKFGHCCLLIEEKGLRLLTDPGSYTTEQNEVEYIDVVLITHEHQDHFHVDSVKKIVANNPGVKIITNEAVAKLLEAADITFTLLKDKENIHIKNVLIEAHEAPHATIHRSLPRVLNSGFFVTERLFYPGDALINPQKPVEILALPVAGPWLKISEALDYALALKPKTCFPVHDAGLTSPDFVQRIANMVLEPNGIKFESIEQNSSIEL